MTAKRDFLVSFETKYQKEWDERKAFEIDAPSFDECAQGTSGDDMRKSHPKFFSTFPYPYQNGRLHLGHAFTFTKCEFATGFERMRGKRALFPFGLHCTGMPIKACADKLKREVELFGPMFEGHKETPEIENLEIKETVATKHSKVAAKSGTSKYQYQIMLQNDVPLEEIHKFADPMHWLYYFPPFSMKDVKSLGCKVDWRRTFFTTDVNPYYDSFVCWQFRSLRKLDKIKFGKRYTIYSPLDGQPCMDHDRSSGEGVGPQDYTAIKIEVLEWSDKSASAVKDLHALSGKKVYMIAATLRPETMYGQTTCFVGVDIEYGLFQTKEDGVVYLATERSARNMAFQGVFAKEGEVTKIGSIKGALLVGSKIRPPLSVYDHVYVLPMDNVLASKGTGVVTCVPSDSPDDFATTQDLAKKAAYYGIEESWIVPFKAVSVLTTPAYGAMTAPALCKEFKINSQKDKDQLAKAKEVAYKEGFYNGTMAIGEFAGRPVQEAKPLVRAAMIAAGQAFAYSEPEKNVMSRSGDECVVSLCDQWYLDYGETEWKKLAEECLGRMETYSLETQHSFEGTLNWLVQWACARSYGLGSKLPWDKQFLIESLSDSTIYMAYYTVAHLLHGGSYDGRTVGPLGITAEQMTDEVWEYVLRGGSFPENAGVAHDKLDLLKREFEYFYPMDLRVSGKDLVPNHLTFFIYNHVALFPKKHWPLGVRANGHLLLNGKKMSKSDGNFMTCYQSVERYGADATRLTMADAGDAVEDANFEESTANAAILRLFTLIEWIQETVDLAKAGKLRKGPQDRFHDRVFEAELNHFMKNAEDAYSGMLYREALKNGFYELQHARDWYRDAMPLEELHQDLILKYAEYQALALAPITPHWSEHVWKEVLKKPTSIMEARWPQVPTSDVSMIHAVEYLKKLTRSVRELEGAAIKKLTKAKSQKAGANKNTNNLPLFDPSKPKTMKIFVAKTFPTWQITAMETLKANFDTSTGKFDDKNIGKIMKETGAMKDKRTMPFVQEIKKRVAAAGGSPAPFERALSFDELDVLHQCVEFLKKNLKYEACVVASTDDDSVRSADEKVVAEIAVPGEPSFVFANTD